MARIVPLHSKASVDRAGRFLIAAEQLAEDYPNDKLAIVNNWRSSHSFPLNTFTVTLRNKGAVVDPECLVAQRIKRLPSIVAKLRRFEGYRLSQIQDIGGCRAVVHDVECVRALVKLYRRSDLKHELAVVDDYLETPQESGYRGVHLIYKYYSDKNELYNGLRIEIQIRSLLQHAWATAVETVGTFVRQALKSSMGEKEWLRFFKLMGSVIAHQEGTTYVADTPSDVDTLIEELRRSAEKLDVVNRLETYGNALRYVEDPEVSQGTQYYLLQLNTADQITEVTTFAKKEVYEALTSYMESEKAPGYDVVLVSADSVTALQRAYPNYFVDTRVFIGLLEDALSGKRLKPEEPSIILASGTTDDR